MLSFGETHLRRHREALSHNPSWTNREFPPDVTRQEVLDNYQDGTSLECPSCNRSAGNNDQRFTSWGPP